VSGIDAGRLNKRVAIQIEGRVPNGQGGYETGWGAVAERPNVWAEIIGLSGDESLRAGVERNVQQWRVTIRRRDDVTTKHRLIHKGQVFEIKSAMPDPKWDDATLLICETQAAPAPTDE
jgi:SPP1 family predicted phage head-tail adaptor